LEERIDQALEMMQDQRLPTDLSRSKNPALARSCCT